MGTNRESREAKRRPPKFQPHPQCPYLFPIPMNIIILLLLKLLLLFILQCLWQPTVSDQPTVQRYYAVVGLSTFSIKLEQNIADARRCEVLSITLSPSLIFNLLLHHHLSLLLPSLPPWARPPPLPFYVLSVDAVVLHRRRILASSDIRLLFLHIDSQNNDDSASHGSI
jgi:hypothetical protein